MPLPLRDDNPGHAVNSDGVLVEQSRWVEQRFDGDLYHRITVVDLGADVTSATANLNPTKKAYFTDDDADPIFKAENSYGEAVIIDKNNKVTKVYILGDSTAADVVGSFIRFGHCASE